MFTGAMLLLAIPVALFFFAPTWIAFHNRKREARWFAVFNVLARPSSQCSARCCCWLESAEKQPVFAHCKGPLTALPGGGSLSRNLYN